jgi:hypothetical protein
MPRITHFEIHGMVHLGCITVTERGLGDLNPISDVRFPTSLTGDGSDAMSVFAYLNRVATDLCYGNVKQERGLRLLLSVCVAIHGFKSRRTRHDVHHRARERYCKFCV